MNFLLVIAATVAVIFVPLSFFLFVSSERYRKRLRLLEIEHAATSTQAGNWQKQADDLEELRRQNAQYLEQKSIAVTERQQGERKLAEMAKELETGRKQRDEAMNARQEAERGYALVLQRMEATEKRMQDWEAQRAENLNASKASIFEVGQQLSSKLLEDHKREAEAAKKENEAMVRKTSETLIEQVMTVTKSVSELKGQGQETQERMATVWRALTTPAGAGHLAEVGLENSLKNLGLEPGRDYVMQYAMSTEESGSLRPDAVIFLPQDMVMVIDSKASKFLLEVAQAESQSSEEEVLQRLGKTMNDHLKALIHKNYSAAIQAAYKEAGRAQQLRNVLNVMYLPSDHAIGHIKRADGEFVHKAEKAGIILAGPASLSGLLSLARFNIGMERQAANQDAIVACMQELMDNIVIMLDYAGKVGRGLKTAADSFDQFARSVNKRLLPKIRQLGGLGVKSNKNDKLPGRIASYEVRLSDDGLMIEGEVEVVEETAGVIEAFPKKVSA